MMRRIVLFDIFGYCNVLEFIVMNCVVDILFMCCKHVMFSYYFYLRVCEGKVLKLTENTQMKLQESKEQIP